MSSAASLTLLDEIEAATISLDEKVAALEKQAAANISGDDEGATGLTRLLLGSSVKDYPLRNLMKAANGRHIKPRLVCGCIVCVYISVGVCLSQSECVGVEVRQCTQLEL